jgi:metal-dependent HD superfamily phosphatase/phosphodiesterase
MKVYKLLHTELKIAGFIYHNCVMSISNKLENNGGKNHFAILIGRRTIYSPINQ